MGLGLSKVFIIFLILSIALGYGTHNWVNGLVAMGIYGGVVIMWRLLTR